MDRSKWEYRKLGEVAKFIGGGTPSKAKEEYYTGNIPWATVRDMTDFCLNQTELCITEQAVKESATNIIPKDTIIISTHVGLGKICILMQDTAINQDLKGVILPSNIDKMYFAAWYKSIRDYIVSNGKGATVKGVTMKFVNDLSIPLPPIQDQQRIVAELDCLNEMIVVKQEQLKEFDKLAQSIFYDMFGDGSWEIRKIKDIATVKIGPFGSALHQSDYISGGTPLVNPIHMVNGAIIADEDFTVSSDKIKELQPYLLKTYDIVFGRRGDIGRCALVTEKECGYLCGTGSMYVRFTIDINPVYSLKILSSEGTRKYLLDNAKGATMLNINGGIVENIEIPLPPLSLQQQFAEKISAIEAQKELVKQSIAETQHLLDYTMDKYFG